MYELQLDPSKIKKEKIIGKGSFGKVWKGSMYGRPVAIKEMIQGANAETIEKEIEILGKIRNPNCVQLIGTFKETDGSIVVNIVTEFLNCGDLTSVIQKQRGKLSEIVKLKILRDIASGLAFLHANNIIHRDLKSDNCLIRTLDPNADNFAVIADFGLSKIALTSNPSDHTKGVGTPAYMAPGKISFLLNELFWKS